MKEATNLDFVVLERELVFQLLDVLECGVAVPFLGLEAVQRDGLRATAGASCVAIKGMWLTVSIGQSTGPRTRSVRCQDLSKG